MKLTANILAFYLLLGSFLPRTDFSQLLKLKDLQEHYQLHQLEAKLAGVAFTLQEFLYDHFIQPDGHDHEGENDHEGLPMSSCSSSVLMAFAKMELEKTPSDLIVFSDSPSFEIDFYSFLSLSGIDRPPC